jgi:beta-phosphoglucomutase-like phosphatase (HAD superfamily)
LAAQRLDLEPEELVAVGDGEFDLRAARKAGVGLVIIVNPNVDKFKSRCDHVVHDLKELKDLFSRLLQRRREEVRR